MLRPAAAWIGSPHWATQEFQEIVEDLMLPHSNPSAAFLQSPQNTPSETCTLCEDPISLACAAATSFTQPPLQNLLCVRACGDIFVSKITHQY